MAARFPNAPPKLHMLWHFLEVADKNGSVGLFAESQLESLHSSFGHLMHDRHFNRCRDRAEQLRRSLADTYSTLTSFCEKED